MSMSASVAETAPPSEKRLAAVLEHRFFLRLHMTAILTATILIGLVTTRGLFLLHVNVFWLRYAVAVITAYAAFVGCVKLWLIYIAARSGGSDWRGLDSINLTSSGSPSSFSSGGGKFGGGGSSGSWSDSRTTLAAAPVVATKSSSKSSGGGGGDDLGELILIVLI